MLSLIKNQSILLDSCIIEHLMSKESNLANNLKDLLSALKENNNKLYISDFSYFEILRSISESKETKARKILKGFGRVEITLERIERACKLYSKYKENESVCSYLPGISDGDILIGSLIFTQHKSLLLTANYGDFPRPFFIEKKVEPIEYICDHSKKNKGKKICIYFYLFEANLKEFEK